ncbi:MAG: TIGR02757 family protein [Bacteroidales bacterium]|nr:TIGR02757 family protein [Bacteroidales bacterium]
MDISAEAIADLLNTKAAWYNKYWFIEDDPICIPHRFSLKEDREIAGFLAATIAWGQRPVIIRNATLLMQWMDFRPYDFIMNAGADEISYFDRFKHRTFNGEDCIYFIRELQRLYREEGGLEKIFTSGFNLNGGDAGLAISSFRNHFFSSRAPGRTHKHVSDPASGSAAKRINMFLRWMVRKDTNGVDFGLWDGIAPSQLCCPLDVHTASVARQLGILRRNANDWRSVMELTTYLRTLDPADPVKYDFALFGLGMYENF